MSRPERARHEERVEKKKVLVICTANSCRSQMAEGWIRHDLGDRVEVFSAGTHPWIVHPLARIGMAEAGADLSGHSSQSVHRVEAEAIEQVGGVCDSAREACPTFPRAGKVVHERIADPVMLGLEGERAVEAFRATRDEIRQRLVARVRREVLGSEP